MKYTMTLMALGLSAALLTGCGSSGDDITTPSNASGIQGTGPGNTPETTADAKASLLGTWVRECDYDEDDDVSGIAEVTFREDGTLTFSVTDYPTKDCTGDSIEEYSEEEEYKVGAKTVGSDGKVAFEFDVFGEDDGEKFRDYFMVRYTSTELLFSGEKEDDSQPDGETPQTRNDYFDPDDKGFSKKK